MLQLADYRSLIALDEAFVPPQPAAASQLPEVLRAVIGHLLADGAGSQRGVPDDVPSEGDVAGLRRLLRALLTVRGPEPLPDDVQQSLDSLLQAERAERQEASAPRLPRLDETLPPSRYPAASSVALWRGDICTLAVDAIVNAANAEMLGCFRPFHACIDNAIHSAAGPRLREDCARIMAPQGHPEPTGGAKATRGYNLPARFVLHTVGPIVEGPLQPEHERSLASCYRACLDLAAELPEVRSVAFCAISTGVFGFPRIPAARIATRTVAEWLGTHPKALELVVFNVFSEEDQAVYEEVLRGYT